MRSQNETHQLEEKLKRAANFYTQVTICSGCTDWTERTMMRNRLVVGCGYVGMAVADRWIAAGDRVFAITRTTSRVDELKKRSILPLVWNWYESTDLMQMGAAERSLFKTGLDTVLICPSHSEVQGIKAERTHVAGIENLIELVHQIQTISEPESREYERETYVRESGSLVTGNAISQVQIDLNSADPAETRWIYLSTTGVHSSEVAEEATAQNRIHAVVDEPIEVDEDSDVNPRRAGPIAAWQAESFLVQQLVNSQSRWARGGRKNALTRLRPAGIYGPGRVPNWKSIAEQAPLNVDPESFLNLVHVDDLAKIIFQFSNSKPKHDLYLVSDNHPVLRREYYEFISQLGGWPKPVYASRVSKRGTRSEGNKRINSNRLHDELEESFSYPTYRMGLESLLREFRIS